MRTAAGIKTTPAQEWAFMMDAVAGPAEEAGRCKHPRVPRPLQHFIVKAAKLWGDKLSHPFTRGEIISIRLYTGARAAHGAETRLHSALSLALPRVHTLCCPP